MFDAQTPDPREESLPKWAQSLIVGLRREIGLAQIEAQLAYEELAAFRGEFLPAKSDTMFEDFAGEHNVALPQATIITFQCGPNRDQTIEVHVRKTDGTLVVDSLGGGPLVVMPVATNAVNVLAPK